MSVVQGTILNPGFFVLAPLAVASVCFACSVGSPDRFIDWPYLWLLFRNISPYFWAVTGIALCVGTSILGAAWCGAGVAPTWRTRGLPQQPLWPCLSAQPASSTYTSHVCLLLPGHVIVRALRLARVA